MTMQNEEYLARLRKAREARSVIKIKFVTLKGRAGDASTLVFEGDDDKIAYGRWIARLKPDLCYEAFVCNGKRMVRELQDILYSDLGSLAERTYLFIDRDFDEHDGFIANDNLFVTDRYSIENYLVSADVVSAIVRDEFPCHELVDLRNKICQQFQKDFEEFLTITREFNRRLFVARKLQIPLEGGGLPARASDYALIDVGQVAAANPPVENTIVLSKPVSPEAETMLSIQFDNMEPQSRYRGKNAMLFFERWLGQLADHFDARSGVFASEPIAGKVRRRELTLGSYASRSPVPEGFGDFLDKIAA
jgi:Protein of unknown function (DUF4435)